MSERVCVRIYVTRVCPRVLVPLCGCPLVGAHTTSCVLASHDAVVPALVSFLQGCSGSTAGRLTRQPRAAHDTIIRCPCLCTRACPVLRLQAFSSSCKTGGLRARWRRPWIEFARSFPSEYVGLEGEEADFSAADVYLCVCVCVCVCARVRLMCSRRLA